MSRKGRKKLYQKRTFYLVCEGENTEPNYFHGINEQLESDEHNIQIKNVKTVHSAPQMLMDEAKNIIPKMDLELNDELWVIYDADRHQKHDRALEIAADIREELDTKADNFHIALSSISFEHWVLLHFERNTTAFNKSEKVEGYLKSTGFFPEYAKKEHTHIYPVLQKRTETASENAAWLRHQMQADKDPIGRQYHTINPYTNVDVLVSRLLSFNLSYFHEPGSDISFNKGAFSITLENWKNTGDKTIISLKTSNHSKRTLRLNTAISIFIKSNKQILIEPEAFPNTDINAGQFKNFDLKFKAVKHNTLCLLIKTNDEHHLIQLYEPESHS